MSNVKSNMGHIILITLSAAIGGFLFGFDSSVINGANGALKIHFNATDYQLAWAVSLALIGAAIGAYFAGRLADMFGRVRCMLAASALFLVSAIGSGVPFGIPDFIFWRVIGGVGIGVASIIAPIYIAETAPAHLRGRLGSMQQFAIVIGIFVALLSNYVIVRLAGSANNELFGGFKAWQIMFWVEIVPAALYGIAAWKLLFRDLLRELHHADQNARGRGREEAARRRGTPAAPRGLPLRRLGFDRLRLRSRAPVHGGDAAVLQSGASLERRRGGRALIPYRPPIGGHPETF